MDIRYLIPEDDKMTYIHIWTQERQLLNPDKTNSSSLMMAKIPESLVPKFPVSFLQNYQKQNLYVAFDSEKSFNNHVAKVYHACYEHLRNL